ncbi:MAG: helix-hairpin-helix domain-containing protein [Deltaproteobacteria bacterium]|nr:helix-hairpin-helix domain-containing protein [Deltaproteobacteria bacterium]
MRPLFPLLSLLLVAPVASARVLPAAIYAENEDELRSLYADGVLTDEDFEVLVELLYDPVDLNTARAGELYDLPGLSMDLAKAIVTERKAAGPFSSIDDLLRVQGVTADVVEQLRPYAETLYVGDKVGKLQGQLTLRTGKDFAPVEVPELASQSHDAAALGYARLPNSYLRGRFRYGKGVRAGVLALAQDGVNALAWSEASRDFTASWGSPYLELSKAYVQTAKDGREVILGSFTTGYGLGLTFDSTNRSLPHGLYPDLLLTGTTSFSPRKGQLGVGATLHRLDLGGSWADVSAFASLNRYDAYQYDVGVAGGEAIDPMLEDEPSPRVWVETADGYKRGGWLTLPNLYQEAVFGGNATYHTAGDKVDVGLTAYMGSLNTAVVEGMDDPYAIVLRSGYPVEHTYGAVGLNGAWHHSLVDLYGEVAKSMTGGVGAMAKALVDLPKGHTELYLRHFSTDFDNPHARGKAAPDEYGGMRDRDEQGVALKAVYYPTVWLSSRVFADLWRHPSTGVANMELYGHLQYKPTDRISALAFVDHKNRDLANNGRTRVYGGDWIDSSDYGLDDLGDVDLSPRDDTEITEGAGASNYFGGQLVYAPSHKVRLSAFYKRRYTDASYWYPAVDPDAFCEYWFQVGHYGWLKAQVSPTDSTTLTLRGRYEDEDVHGSKGNRVAEGYLALTQQLPKRLYLSTRATLIKNLDDPENAWKGTCESAGAPDLCGSCVCEESADNLTTDAAPLTTQGMFWVTLDWRF